MNGYNFFVIDQLNQIYLSMQNAINRYSMFMHFDIFQSMLTLLCNSHLVLTGVGGVYHLSLLISCLLPSIAFKWSLNLYASTASYVHISARITMKCHMHFTRIVINFIASPSAIAFLVFLKDHKLNSPLQTQYEFVFCG